MPYNLRKRKAPEGAPIAVKPMVKPKKPRSEVEQKPRKEVEQKPRSKVEQKPRSEVEQKPRSEIEQKPRSEVEQKPRSEVEQKPNQTQLHQTNQYIFGKDSCGEIGLGKIGFVKRKPMQTPISEPIRQVACGTMHTVSLTTSGKVYTYGCNDEAALGRVTEDEDEEATPTLVQLDHKISKVTAGDNHTACLSEDHKVFIWGNFRDSHGPIGLLPECNGEKTYKPILVMPDTDFKDIASGANHILLLDSEGNIYSFGVGSQGQLGRLEPEQMGPNDKESFPIDESNRELFLKPHKVDMSAVDPSRPFICDAVFAGNDSSFATNTDKKKNRTAGWGLNNYFQLGYKGTKGKLIQPIPKRSTFTCSTNMINVACGQHHTLFLTKSGRVYVAGKTLYGLLGLGDSCIKSSETVCPAKNITKLGSNVIMIAVGNNTSFALTDEGKLYSWGMCSPSLGVDLEEGVDLTEPTEVKILEEKKVASVSSGSGFTAILVS